MLRLDLLGTQYDNIQDMWGSRTLPYTLLEVQKRRDYICSMVFVISQIDFLISFPTEIVSKKTKEQIPYGESPITQKNLKKCTKLRLLMMNHCEFF